MNRLLKFGLPILIVALLTGLWLIYRGLPVEKQDIPPLPLATLPGPDDGYYRLIELLKQTAPPDIPPLELLPRQLQHSPRREQLRALPARYRAQLDGYAHFLQASQFHDPQTKVSGMSSDYAIWKFSALYTLDNLLLAEQDVETAFIRTNQNLKMMLQISQNSPDFWLTLMASSQIADCLWLMAWINQGPQITNDERRRRATMMPRCPDFSSWSQRFLNLIYHEGWQNFQHPAWKSRLMPVHRLQRILLTTHRACLPLTQNPPWTQAVDLAKPLALLEGTFFLFDKDEVRSWINWMPGMLDAVNRNTTLWRLCEQALLSTPLAQTIDPYGGAPMRFNSEINRLYSVGANGRDEAGRGGREKGDDLWLPCTQNGGIK